jgi:hypothetical protein
MSAFDVLIGLVLLLALGRALWMAGWLALFVLFPCTRCCGLRRYSEPGSWTTVVCQLCDGSGWKVRGRR